MFPQYQHTAHCLRWLLLLLLMPSFPRFPPSISPRLSLSATSRPSGCRVQVSLLCVHCSTPAAATAAALRAAGGLQAAA
jgi:hypothetical protein